MFATLDRTEESKKVSSVMTADKERVNENNGKRGMDMLFGPDFFSNIKNSATTAQAPVSVQVEENVAEDERPSETTMQFVESDVSEFAKNAQNTESDNNYHMTTRTKMMLVIYSVVVGVILALIIMNSSVLASISKSSAAKRAELVEITNEYNAVKAQYEELSSDTHVINVAEQEYNMVR